MIDLKDVPTHDLMEEVSRRAVEDGIETMTLKFRKKSKTEAKK